MWNLGAFPSEHRTQASHLTPKTQLLDTQSRRERGHEHQVIGSVDSLPQSLKRKLAESSKV